MCSDCFWERYDYLFALKENQGTLYEDVKTYFEDVDQAHSSPNVAAHTTFDADHGRLETRFHGITADVSWLVERNPAWKSIKSIGIIDSQREIGTRFSMNGACMFLAYPRPSGIRRYRTGSLGDRELVSLRA